MRALFIFFILVSADYALAQGWFNADRIDVNERGYTSAVVTVGVTEVEVKTGASRNEKRQRVLIYNDSSSIVYYGPTGVTVSGSTRGIPIFKKQVMVIPVGDIAIYLIAGSAGNEVIVQVLE